MGLIGAAAVAILAILGAAISRQITDEFKAWMPWIIRRIIQRAVRQLPEGQRERFAEEWSSHVNEIPGDVGKLVAAMGFLSASCKISVDASDLYFALSKRTFDIFLSMTLIFVLAPLYFVIAIAVVIDSPGPIFSFQRIFHQQHTGSFVPGPAQ